MLAADLTAQLVVIPAVDLLELGGEELFGAAHGLPQLGAHALAHVDEDLQIALGVLGFDGLVHRADEVLVAAEVRGDQAVVLGKGGQGQDEVAQTHDCGGHEDLVGDDEVERQHGLVPALGLVCHAGEGVGADHPAHAQLVGHVLELRKLALEVVEKGVALNAAHGGAGVEELVLARGVDDVLGGHLRVEHVHHLVAPLTDEARGST